MSGGNPGEEGGYGFIRPSAEGIANSDKEPEEGMRDFMDASVGGAVAEVLPDHTDDMVAMGIVVAVEALQDRNERAAKAALETAAGEIDADVRE